MWSILLSSIFTKISRLLKISKLTEILGNLFYGIFLILSTEYSQQSWYSRQFDFFVILDDTYLPVIIFPTYLISSTLLIFLTVVFFLNIFGSSDTPVNSTNIDIIHILNSSDFLNSPDFSVPTVLIFQQSLYCRI